LLPRETLAPDVWFSIQAAGRLSPSTSDVVIVYQNGQAVYMDQNTGKQYQNQLRPDTIERWKRIFTDETNFMSLKDSYPPSTPQPDDSVHYKVSYRDGETVKTVTAQNSGAPPELQFIFHEFWKLVDQVQHTS
jgi:hypothetical protein